jgi:glutamyl-tRNA reductase
MAIVAVGVSHKTVSLPVLERLAVPRAALGKTLARLLDFDPIHEAAVLSTCNRTEIYATVHRFHPAVQAARMFLSDVSGVAQEEIADGLYTYYDTGAVRHLFAVASGVDSMVVGEPQILGQVREAFLAAQEEGTARRLLSALFQRALRVGKRARTETAIARHVVSLPQAAARTAADLAGERPDATIVVIGAGRMGELAARAVAEAAAGDLIVCNRNIDNARALADAIGARAVGLDALPALLRSADVVISATSSGEPVVRRATLEAALAERSSSLVAIDLGMPRDIDPDARGLERLQLRDIDDLRAVVESGASKRLAEVPKVQGIVDEEVESFCAWERSLALGPSISALQEWAEDVRAGEIAKLAKRLRLDDKQRATLEASSRTLVKKLLHRPVTEMKELVLGRDGQVYLETFQEIFGLDLDAGDD